MHARGVVKVPLYKEMDMTKMAALKAQAKNLHAALVAQGVDYSLSQAQEAVAQQYGIANWDTLCGLVTQKAPKPRTPVLADLPGIPDTVQLEQGLWTKSYQVASYDWELIELLHKPKELQEFLDNYPELYEDGLDTTAILLEGDGQDIALTARQLMDGRYESLGGRSYWFIPDIDGYLSFGYETPWVAPPAEPAPFELTVPSVVKSIKGTRIIAMRSHEGADYDHFALVPPHLKAEQVAQAIRAEVQRLHAADQALMDGQEDREYTVEDVRKFVELQGCLWVEELVEMGTNWDMPTV